MTFIKYWKVDGALVSPKGITLNWKYAWWVLKASLGSSPGTNLIWWNLEARSMVEKYYAPAISSRNSSMMGKGNLFFIVILLSLL
jgi:hypothetical protein